MTDIVLLQVVVLVCGTTALVSSLRFLRRYLELRHERALRAEPGHVAEKLERIEQAVEATALEVERMAEANRFLAKLLADRVASSAPLSRTPERVITPH